MSDSTRDRTTPRPRSALVADRGMTLPELLIAVAVHRADHDRALERSIIVTMRQSDNTEGRLNVARGEQNVDMYLPDDLASAESIDTRTPTPRRAGAPARPTSCSTAPTP